MIYLIVFGVAGFIGLQVLAADALSCVIKAPRAQSRYEEQPHA